MKVLKTADFDYILPESQIAYEPAAERTASRLLQVKRKSGAIISDGHFRDLEQILNPGDVLVLNDTKVFPARLIGKRKSGGRVEALLLKPVRTGRWEALIKPSGRLKAGEFLEFGENGFRIQAEVVDDPGRNGRRLLDFPAADLFPALEKVGHVPLPPYIRREDHAGDKKNYQTVFAQKRGAVAAPTAGLHFDEGLLSRLQAKGIETVFVTLHVSYGTFQPVTVEKMKDHRVSEEDYEVSAESAERINLALEQGRRVIACGTTVVRTLETAGRRGTVRAGKGTTGLFIHSPFKFKITQGLITNFHLPKTSLLALVAAFLGSRPRLLKVYNEAVRRGYRFYSYGDAMCIL